MKSPTRFVLVIVLAVVCSLTFAQDNDKPGEGSDLVVIEGKMQFLPRAANVTGVLVKDVEDDSVALAVHHLQLVGIQKAGSAGSQLTGYTLPEMQPGDRTEFVCGNESGFLELVRVERPQAGNRPVRVHFRYGLTIDEQERVRMMQRSTRVLPGLDGQVQVTIGDVTRGQTITSIKTKEGEVLFGAESLREGDEVTFTYADRQMKLTLDELDNNLVNDFAVFELTPVEPEPQDAREEAQEEEPVEAPAVAAPPEAVRPAGMSLRPGTSVTFGRGKALATLVVGPVDGDVATLGILDADGEWVVVPGGHKAEQTVEFNAGGQHYAVRVLQVGGSGVEGENVILQVVSGQD
jgi:hypothetical protein